MTRSSSDANPSASKELLETFADRVYAVPTMGGVRSLNLANSVGIVLFDALRKLGVMDTTFSD